MGDESDDGCLTKHVYSVWVINNYGCSTKHVYSVWVIMDVQQNMFTVCG